MTHSMTCERFEHILPQLLDDEASGAATTPIVRAHLDSCADCRSLLADLNAIRAEARALPALQPSRDLWSGIAERIEAPVVPLVEGVRVRPFRRQLSVRSAGLAAAALIAVTTAVTYRVARRGDATTVALAPMSPTSRVASIPDSLTTITTTDPRVVPPQVTVAANLPFVSAPQAGRSAIVLASNQQAEPRPREVARVVYDREVVRLRAIVDSGRRKLDPATAANIDRSLKVIDTAIEQCREALTKDSASVFLIESLNNAYQTKVKVLRLAAAMVSRG